MRTAKKVFVYIHSVGRNQKESALRQKELCTEYVTEKGLNVPESFFIVDYEAVRPQLHALLQMAVLRPGSFDCLIVNDFSQLGDDLSDVLRVRDSLFSLGIEVKVRVAPGINWNALRSFGL